ncbi:uncharacterized protein LOC135094643 [Scylla paramamosain]|uniref:uncharacterized protein LOC135094643 n=1 Tax=Scylla paramamosain TaxID=85552 RepID=UPI00308319FE
MEDLLCLGDVDGQGVAGVKVECKEESREVEVTPEVVDKLISSNAQLSQAVAQLCNKFDQMGHMQNMVWSRPVPTIGKFSGRVRRASELDDWVEDATEKIKQLGLQGSEGVSYLCGFLEGPARRRVRNSTVKTVSDLFDCLRSAFGPELNYTDLEKQLHARVQQPGEGVWEFADSLGVIVDKIGKRESLRTRGQLSRPDDRAPTTAQIRSVTNVTEERNDVKRGKVKLFGKTLRIDALVNGIPVSAMADSGAEVSLVTEEWYKQHLLPKQAVIYGMDIRITDANGREIPCLGYVKWKVAKVSHGREVTVGRAHTHTVAQTAPPSVVKEFKDRLGVQVDESQLDSAQLERLDGLIHEYGDVFAENEQDLGCATGVEHEIHLNSAVPIRLPYRHIPPPCITEVKAHVKGLLEQGVIEESVSPYAAPIVMVRKKDGSLRLCVDYRRLNEVTVKDAFPLPRVQDTLDALAGAQYFSSFDLAAGYHQILVRAEDRPKTAFVTPFGHYQYVRCPMGLSNSPATFQRFMEYVFSDQVFVTLLVYLDDLLVFARSVDEHLDRLEGMLKLLRKHGLKLKPSKCHILKPQVRYLGFIISKEGINTDPEKIRAVQEWPVPRTVREVRAFVAFCSFYRRFVKNFAKVAAPLHALMSGDSKAAVSDYWGKDEARAFALLKEKLSQAPVLKSADYSKQFVVETDASFEGLGAVLSQEHDGRLHPVAFASRGLRKSERNMSNYSSRKLELLALKWAVTEQFKHYLVGGHFIVLTDNNPLAHLNSAKLGAVESRWLGDLGRFDFEVKYRPGKENGNADGLSRRPQELIEGGEEEKEIWETSPNSSVKGVAVMQVWRGASKEQLRDMQQSCPVVGKLWRQMIGRLRPAELRQLLQVEEFRQWWRCKVCVMGKEEGVRAKTKLGTLEANRPWEVLAVDFTLLDPARDGKENVLVVTDVFSKFALAFPTKNQKASTVAKILVEEIFHRFGCPERVHSDQGTAMSGNSEKTSV